MGWGIRAVLVTKNEDPSSMFDHTVDAVDRTTRARSISAALHQLEMDVMHYIVAEGIEEVDVLDIEFHLSRLPDAPPASNHTTPMAVDINRPSS